MTKQHKMKGTTIKTTLSLILLLTSLAKGDLPSISPEQKNPFRSKKCKLNYSNNP